MQAVLQPGLAAADDRAQARAAGADHHHVVGVVLDRIGAAVDGRRVRSADCRCAAPWLRLRSCSLSSANAQASADRDREEGVGHDQQRASIVVMHIVLDDDLHADPHMRGDRDNEQQHDHGDQRRAEDLRDGRMVAAEQRDHDDDERDGERDVGDRGEALAPEMLGAGAGGAETAHARERRAHLCTPPSARSSHEQIAEDPDHDRQRDRTDQRREREPFALVRAEAACRCPRSDGGCRRACDASAPRCSRTGSAGRTMSS